MIKPGYTIPVLDHGFVRYVDHMGSDQRIVEAARVSYKGASKGPDADKKLLQYLWKNKHLSPFEMAKLTLNIKMPIFVMRQYVRHRMQNMNEVSARYTELPNEFYIPKEWRKQDVKNKQNSTAEKGWNPWHKVDGSVGSYITGSMDATGALERHCARSYEFYEQLLADGVAREMARMVLPINIYTEIYACWDLRNLLGFITLREDNHAQYEIQEYGRAIKSLCMELFPWAVEAYEKYKWKVVEG
jgi:thymidylate synthase (FAD)